MHRSSLRTLLLLLSCLLLAVLAAGQGVAGQVEENDQVPSQQQQQAAHHDNDKPKLFKPRTGIMKEDYDVDPGNQRARADEVILENAEDYQPEQERVIDSMDDLSWVVSLAGLYPKYDTLIPFTMSTRQNGRLARYAECCISWSSR
jgi:hypothetical protein